MGRFLMPVVRLRVFIDVLIILLLKHRVTASAQKVKTCIQVYIRTQALAAA